MVSAPQRSTAAASTAATAKDSPESAVNLQLFWQLSRADANVRAQACAGLIEQLQQSDDAQGSAMQYALKRLLRGFASSARAARQGFAVALTCILQHFGENVLPTRRVLELIDEHIAVMDVCASRRERRDVEIGRVFALMVLARAGRIDQLSEKQLLDSAKRVARLATLKKWAAPLSAHTLAVVVASLSSPALIRVVLRAVDEEHEDDRCAWPETFMIRLAVAQRCREVPGVQLDDAVAQHGSVDLFSAEFAEALSATVCARPRAHPLWILALNDAANTSTFAKFWNTNVDSVLFANGASVAQVCTGLAVVEAAASAALSSSSSSSSSSSIATIASPNVVQCLLRNLAVSSSALNAAAVGALTRLVAAATAAGSTTCSALLDALRFDFGFRTKSMELLSPLFAALSRDEIDAVIAQIASKADCDDVVQQVNAIETLFAIAKIKAASGRSACTFALMKLGFFAGANLSRRAADMAKERFISLATEFAGQNDVDADEDLHAMIDRAISELGSPSNWDDEAGAARSQAAKALAKLSKALKNDQGTSSRPLMAARILLVYFGVYQLVEPDAMSDLLVEMAACCKDVLSQIGKKTTTKEQKKKKKKKNKAEVLEEVPEASVCAAMETFGKVGVDMLLSVLVKDSLLLRTVSRRAFHHLRDVVTADTFLEMLRVVNPSKDDADEPSDADDDEDDDDDDDSVLEAVHVSDEDSDAEMQEEDGEPAAAETQKQEHKDDGEEEDDDGDAEDDSIDLDASEAQDLDRYDRHLADYIRLRQNTKKQAKNMKLHVTNFQLRVLDLIESYIRAKPNSALAPLAVAPLLAALKSTQNCTDSALLHQKIANLLLRRIFQHKQKRKKVSTGVSTETCRDLVQTAFRWCRSKLPGDVCTNAALYSIRVLLKNAANDAQQQQEAAAWLGDRIGALLRVYLTTKKSRLSTTMFVEMLTRNAAMLSAAVLPHAADLVPVAASRCEFLGVEALRVLDACLRALTMTPNAIIAAAMQQNAAKLLVVLDHVLVNTRFTKPTRVKAAFACIEALAAAAAACPRDVAEMYRGERVRGALVDAAEAHDDVKAVVGRILNKLFAEKQRKATAKRKAKQHAAASAKKRRNAPSAACS